MILRKKDITLLDKVWSLTPLTLRYASELIDYQFSGKPIPYEFKLNCFIDGVKLKDGSSYERLTEEKINLCFIDNPLAFNTILHALISFTLEDDLKKSAEYVSIATQSAEK